MVTKTLYVGNLPWSVTDEELGEAFRTVVEVRSTRVITDRETGRSRGFGFVEIDDEDVERVVATMNGMEIHGRQIIVNEARPRQPRY